MPESKEHKGDTYYMRFLWLKKYVTRIKIVMTGTAGLLFFVASDLITDLEKIIATLIIIINLFIGYTALLGFDDAMVDIENKLNDNENMNNARVIDSFLWPKTSETLYQFCLWLTALTALALLVCMVVKFRIKNQENPKRMSCLSLKFLHRTDIDRESTFYADSAMFKVIS